MIKDTFIRAFAALWADKAQYIAEYEDKLKFLTDTAAFDKETAILTAECAEASALVDDCIAANAASAMNQAEYQSRYDDLVKRFDIAKNQLDTLTKDKLERIAHKEKLTRFLKTLHKTKTAPSVFDENLWRKTVETMTINSLEDIAVRFYSGTEIDINTK